MPHHPKDRLELEEEEWPFPARRIRRDEAPWVSLLLTGLREKYHLPFNVVTDLELLWHGQPGRVIKPEGSLYRYPEFCQFLRNNLDENDLCDQSTMDNIKVCLQKEHWGIEPVFQKKCHMGLRNFYLPIKFYDKLSKKFYGKTIGYCVAGQFCLEGDKEEIIRRIEALPIRIPSITHDQLSKLRTLLDKSTFLEDTAVENIKQRLTEGVSTLRDILWTNYLKNRRTLYRKMREDIETELFHLTHSVIMPDSSYVKEILKQTCKLLSSKYLAIFLSQGPESNILDLVVQYGLGEIIKTDITFNWNKAKLEKEITSFKKWDILNRIEDLRKGIKGMEKSRLQDFSYLYPFRFADHYGAVVLGPFDREVDIDREKEHLNPLCQVIGLRICEMAVMDTYRRKDQQKDLPVAIASHTVRHGLQNIKAELSMIRLQIKRSCADWPAIKAAVERAIDDANKGIDGLVRSFDTALTAPDAIKAISLELQREHLEFKPLTIKVIIDECLRRHKKRAEMDGIQIIVEDESLENLPGIMADQAVLQLAFDNLLENSLRYTGQGRYVDIKAQTFGYDRLMITINNRGLEITKQELDHLFDLGVRGQAAMKHHPAGYGIGLHQVKKIIDLHFGEISVDNMPKGPGEWDHVTSFKIFLPTILGFQGALKKWKK